MNKKLLIYSVVSLLTGSAIAISATGSSTQARTATTLNNFELNSPQTSALGRNLKAQIPEVIPEPNLTSIPKAKLSQSSPPQQGMMRTQIDQHFIEMMIPHHQDAVEMADLALSKAKHPEIKKLAEAIKRDQTREIKQMQAWYKQWYGKAVPATPMMGMGMMGQNHNSGMMGTGQAMSNMDKRHDMMGMAMDLEALKKSPDFDREFIRQMIPHHQMAVMMSQMVLNSSTHPEIRTLAQSIIKSQTAEIQQMRQWYQTWYGQS